MASVYRKRGAHTVRFTVSVSDDTQAKLKQIQKAFATRWPKNTYPTLSAVLEELLNRHARELESDPAWLDAEVAEFQRRYLTAK